MNIALLEYYVFEGSIALLLAVDGDPQPQYFKLDITEIQLKRSVEQFQQQAENYNPTTFPGAQRPAIYDRFLMDFYCLGETLLAPCKTLVESVDLLYIVPHKELHYLPFHMMKLAGRYVIKQFQVAYLPVAQLIEHCQQKNPYRQHNTLPSAPLLLACWEQQDDPESIVATAHTDEIQQLANLFHCDGHIGLAATKQKLLTQSHNADLLHIASHGYFFDSDNPMSSSGINLTDGNSFAPSFTQATQLEQNPEYFVSASELLNVQMDNCHLITLSCCSSGQSENQAGDELLGLARALFYVGAPTLLLTLWQAQVNSKQVFMKAFYQHWLTQPERGKAWAFQQAVLQLLADDEYKIPFHWGCYYLVGDWL